MTTSSLVFKHLLDVLKEESCLVSAPTTATATSTSINELSEEGRDYHLTSSTTTTAIGSSTTTAIGSSVYGRLMKTCEALMLSMRSDTLSDKELLRIFSSLLKLTSRVMSKLIVSLDTTHICTTMKIHCKALLTMIMELLLYVTIRLLFISDDIFTKQELQRLLIEDHASTFLIYLHVMAVLEVLKTGGGGREQVSRASRRSRSYLSPLSSSHQLIVPPRRNAPMRAQLC
jgi:hypothetical protein